MKKINQFILCLTLVIMSAIFVTAPVKADKYISLKKAAIASRAKVENQNETVQVRFKSKSSDYMSLIEKFFDYVFEDNKNHNQGDYMKWNIDRRQVTYLSRTKEPKDKYYKYDMKFTISYLMTKKQCDKVNSKVNNLISGWKFTSSTTDYEKVKKIYDYVCDNVEYSESTKNEIVYTAYSALFEKNAVCQGYAQLIYKMCRVAGVDCRLISGKAKSGEIVDYHGWNIVKIGKYYYNIDSTWDAQRVQNNLKYEYFLIGDGMKNHFRDSILDSYKFYNDYPMSAYNYNLGWGYSTKTLRAKFSYKKPKFNKLGKKHIKIKKISSVLYYEVKSSKSASMKKANTKKTSKTKIKIGNRRYVKVRAAKKIGGKKIFSKWRTKKV